MRHHSNQPDHKFVLQPEPFNKYTEHGLLRYCLGATMYMPGTKDFLQPILTKKYPGLTLICAHFGGYSEWEDAVRCLADTNVYVDTSSTSFRLPPERVKELIGVFGEDRVLFGTDFPMWSAQPEIDLLLSLGLPEGTMRKIFSENILRLLG